MYFDFGMVAFLEREISASLSHRLSVSCRVGVLILIIDSDLVLLLVGGLVLISSSP